MKSEIRNPKSETNPKSEFSKSKICFGHFNFGNSRFFRISVFNIRIFILICILLMMGCEAFVRKFTRKPKKENLPREEMVVAPEEYQSPVMSPEEEYRQYFLYWKSWHDELIESLGSSTNQKKQVGCATEAMKNLEQAKSLLTPEKQKKLAMFLNQFVMLKMSLVNDIYSRRMHENRRDAERLRRDIIQNFSFPLIKKDLVPRP